MTHDVALLLVANGCFLVAGLGVTRAIGWWRTPGDAPRALGVAYVAGVAATGVLGSLLLVAGASLALWQVLAVVAALALLGAIPRRDDGLTGPPLERPPLVLVGLVLGVLALLAVAYWFQPLWSFDAWTFWTPKARAIVAFGGLDASWFGAPGLLNRDYPLLLPALEASVFRFTGTSNGILDLQSLALVCGFALAYVEITGRRAAGLVVWTVLLMAVAAPSLGVQGAYAEADVPLAAFVGVGALAAWIWLRERKRPALALLVLLAAAAAATKTEGTAFALALLLPVAALVARDSRRDAVATVLVGLAALAVVLVPWRLWLSSHDVPNQASLHRIADPSFLASHADRVPLAGGRLAWELVDPSSWLLLVPLAVVAAIAALRAGRADGPLLLGGILVVCWLGLLLAYWTTPFEIHFHLATSARRVIDAPVLVCAALTPLLLADAGTRRREGDHPPSA